MDQSDQLNAAFRSISGSDLFRGNVFRLSGLSPHASTAEIRRRRNEVNAAVRLQAPVPPGPVPGPAVGPDPAPQALQAAFELMRDPRVRLVHELLWLWSEDGDELATEHDTLIVEHAALLGETWADAQPAAPSASGNERWRRVLVAWIDMLDREALWERMHRRADEYGDNRAVAVVGRLRERVQAHLLDVNAALAAHVAPNALQLATDHTTMLRALPFPAGLADRVLQARSQAPEKRITALTGPAVDRVDRAPDTGPQAAVDLLAWTFPPLRTVAALRGWRDPTTAALSDAVAEAVRAIAVLHVNAIDQRTFDPLQPLTLANKLLAKALDLARDPSLRSRIIADSEAVNSMRSMLLNHSPRYSSGAFHYPLPTPHPDPTGYDRGGTAPDAERSDPPRAPAPPARLTRRPVNFGFAAGPPRPSPGAAERAQLQRERQERERERWDARVREREERLRAERAAAEAERRQQEAAAAKAAWQRLEDLLAEQRRQQEAGDEQRRRQEADPAAPIDLRRHKDPEHARIRREAERAAAEAEARAEAAAQHAAERADHEAEPSAQPPRRRTGWLNRLLGRRKPEEDDDLRRPPW